MHPALLPSVFFYTLMDSLNTVDHYHPPHGEGIHITGIDKRESSPKKH